MQCVLTILPYSRIACTTLRAANNGEALRDLASGSRPCWAGFFEHSRCLLGRHVFLREAIELSWIQSSSTLAQNGI